MSEARVAVLEVKVDQLEKKSTDQESRLRLLEAGYTRLGGKASLVAALGSVVGAALFNFALRKWGG